MNEHVTCQIYAVIFLVIVVNQIIKYLKTIDGHDLKTTAKQLLVTVLSVLPTQPRVMPLIESHTQAFSSKFLAARKRGRAKNRKLSRSLAQRQST